MTFFWTVAQRSWLPLAVALMAWPAPAVLRDSDFPGLSTGDRAALKSLLLEFPVEVSAFDGTTEVPEHVLTLKNIWNQSLAQSRVLPTELIDGKSWSAALRDFPQVVVSKSGAEIDLEKIPALFDRSAHSIEHPDGYAEARIGSKIAQALRDHRIATIVYGGGLESLEPALDLGRGNVIRLPSVYASWGIEKLFASGKAFADGRPRFILAIPPSRQYVHHYAQLFLSLDLKLDRAVLNKADQRDQLNGWKRKFADLRRKTGGVDAVILGYYPQMRQALNAADEIPLQDGLFVSLAEDKTRNLRLMLLKSDRTIWGESSALLAQAALEMNPRALFFMGSAGGIDEKTKVYDISVPQGFSLKDRRLPVRNEVFEQMLKTAPPGVTGGAIHGHTDSPIVQTRTYVSEKIRQGIATIDVEQNLIAEMLVRENKLRGSPVMFGALNLITDKPSSLDFSFGGHNLDAVKTDAKARARQRAVNLALETLRASPRLRAPLCGRVLLEVR